MLDGVLEWVKGEPIIDRLVSITKGVGNPSEELAS